jgi:hypothetical protein
LHYVEPLDAATYRHELTQLLDFWHMAIPILKMLRLSGELTNYAGATCELRVEVYLRNVSGRSFSSHTDPFVSAPITTVAASVPALAQASSSNLPQSAPSTVVDLMYQLRWPFGEQPAPTIAEVRRTVEKMVSPI